MLASAETARGTPIPRRSPWKGVRSAVRSRAAASAPDTSATLSSPTARNHTTVPMSRTASEYPAAACSQRVSTAAAVPGRPASPSDVVRDG